MAERAEEVPAELSPRKDEQQAKDLALRHFEPPEEQKGQLQVCSLATAAVPATLLRKCSCDAE